MVRHSFRGLSLRSEDGSQWRVLRVGLLKEVIDLLGDQISLDEPLRVTNDVDGMRLLPAGSVKTLETLWLYLAVPHCKEFPLNGVRAPTDNSASRHFFRGLVHRRTSPSRLSRL